MPSTAAYAFKTCVGLNTQAIHLMREGRHRDSSQALRLALECLKPCMGLPTSEHFGVSTHVQRLLGDFQAEELRNITSSPGHSLPPNISSVSISCVLTQVDPGLLESNIFCFCPSMYYVSLADAYKLGLPKVFFLTLYNQAVSKHVQTLHYLSQYQNQVFQTSSPNQGPQELLASVYRLYQATLDIPRMSFSTHDHHQMAGVLAAATNNAGCVASALRMTPETDVCIQLLKGWMVTYKAAGSVVAPGSLPATNASIFFESICIFLGCQEGRPCLTTALAA